MISHVTVGPALKYFKCNKTVYNFLHRWFVNRETNLMSLINPLLAYVYCSNLVSNHGLIRFIRFVLWFTVHLCNAIFFNYIWYTMHTFYKSFGILKFRSKQGLSLQQILGRGCGTWEWRSSHGLASTLHYSLMYQRSTVQKRDPLLFPCMVPFHYTRTLGARCAPYCLNN